MSKEPEVVPDGMVEVDVLMLSPEVAAAVRRLAGQLELVNAGDVFGVALRLVHGLALAHRSGGVDLIVAGQDLCIEVGLNDVLSGRPWAFRRFEAPSGE